MSRSASTPAVDRRLFVTLPLAIAAVQLVWGGIDLLLAASLDQIEARSAVTTFGWITGIASLCALLVYPLVGALSDRTPPRWGRRSAWVAVGAGGSSLGLLLLGQAQSVGLVGVSYVVAFGFLPVILVPLYASIPDRVEVGRRGAIGAVLGSATIAGGVAGNVVAAEYADRIQAGAIVFAAVLAAGAAAFVLLGRERASPTVREQAVGPASRQPRTRTGRYGDLAWYAVGRFALFVAYASVTGLAYFVVRDHVGRADPAAGVAGFAVVTGATTLLAALAAGFLSDRLARRKPFVVGASLVLGLGVMVPAFEPSFGAFLVAAAVIGVGFGTYLAVGTALATLVLPDSQTTGRDIGVVGLASASAQAVAPVGGSLLADSFGYPALFAAAAVACLVAAAAVLPIRSVR